MTRRFGLITVATLLLGVGTLFVWRHSLRRELPLAQLPAQEMERKGQGDEAQGVPYDSKAEKPVRFDELPPHIKQAAQELVHFAAAARLFNFNPQITGFREDVHPFRKDVTNVVIETATHGASFINGRMDKVFSLYD